MLIFKDVQGVGGGKAAQRAAAGQWYELFAAGRSSTSQAFWAFPLGHPKLWAKSAQWGKGAKAGFGWKPRSSFHALPQPEPFADGWMETARLTAAIKSCLALLVVFTGSQMLSRAAGKTATVGVGREGAGAGGSSLLHGDTGMPLYPCIIQFRR